MPTVRFHHAVVSAIGDGGITPLTRNFLPRLRLSAA
jgi:hypothetical protein